MTKFINPGLMKTSRRNVLRGSVLAGAAAMTGAGALAAPRRQKLHKADAASAKIYKAAAEQKAESTAKPADLSGYTRVKQELVAPPFAPEHEQVATGGPKIVEVELVTTERMMIVDEDTGASIWALTYNGSVPGPLIIVHEGDIVEMTIRNPVDSAMEHNVDFHASTGALGGGGLTHVYPGEEAVLRWKATKPGCFTYHCAPGGAMIPYHVCHGMNGAVMVLPRDGLKDKDGNQLKYDKIAYMGEQDYYLPKDENGDFKFYDTAGDDYADSLEAMATLTPTHQVFNGAVGALTGQGALKFNVGETVLMVHNSCNVDSRPHLIGGHGDYVWETSFDVAPLTSMETWFVRGGSAAAAMYTFEQPGVYAYVNHNLIIAALKGATAHFVVEGEWDNNLMEQVVAPRPFEA
ncbi:copper-containing nitrite reductase [Roseovarius nanhaiticus]|uniref:Copper-containing nitrite reductase n=1 Tax=Roseovarius nanhaiticus TaxID=573024 RepID=A0A1N7GXZ2_9RHOB|nr:copper-containing nitrite reductase [Roseovarius nanhaiticus]SEL20253.1 dissimilatory nitrite reductase (NO-forming), copper type apoprotein [Roseovarius nanhaiticus]SIS17422.1 dissimilatory nitrite reductase (NO-forming), copper type apoprotein [Roseovarius nanhaiticus]